MDRRQFLAAAATLAGFPGATEAAERAEVTKGDYGTAKASLPSHGGLWSDTEVYVGGIDEETSVSVNGFGFDGDEEEPGVDMYVSNRSVNLTIGLSVDEARELAADLVVAADHAEDDDQ